MDVEKAEKIHNMGGFICLPNYIYKALDKDGVIVLGEIERENTEQVKDFIKANDFLIIEIKRKNFLTLDVRELDFFNIKIKTKELALICRQLSFMLEVGVTLDKSLELILNNSKNKFIKKKINNTRKLILKGESFSFAFKEQKIFPEFMISMLKVGEASGNLDYVMDELATYYEKQSKTESNVLGAMIYPFIVLVATLFLIIVSIFYVVPSFTHIFDVNNMRVSLLTRLIVGASAFLISYKIPAIILSCAILLLISIFLKSKRGKRQKDLFLIKFSIYKKAMSFRFASVMSILNNSGVSIMDSLEITKGVFNNEILKEFFDKAIFEIKRGKNLSYVFKDGKYFDNIISEMISIGEELGMISSVLDKSKDYLEFELDNKIKQTNKLIEPIFTIILGIVLLIIVVAIIIPTFSAVEDFF